MGTPKHKHRKAVNHRKPVRGNRSLVAFVVIGLISDLLTALGLLVKIVGWPMRAASRAIHGQFKHHPLMRAKHAHTIISVALGVGVLALSYAIQHAFQHPVWEMGIETTRAAGVCPIWEAIAATTKIGKDLA